MFLTKLFKKLSYWKCLTCEHFCWWDGDYYCFERKKILIKSHSGRITQEQYDALCKRCKLCPFYKEKHFAGNLNGFYIPLKDLIKK